ncbi:MAG: hypothetical protein HY074_02395 [Deltaproteobacteria bacterium]|nr:hypothetical protein [Deltaproteobacteria bacterium]
MSKGIQLARDLSFFKLHDFLWFRHAHVSSTAITAIQGSQWHAGCSWSLPKGIEMKPTKSNLSMGLVAFSLVFAGCGKDMKLGIKAAETEKDQPSAALVRNVQVTYHTPAGKEEMRESIPVLGLSQPVSTRADLLKDLHVEKDGVFEARGYTADGILVLRGQALANPEAGDAIEITLDREASQATLLGSPVLRRIKLADAAISQSFERTAKEFQAGSANGRCVEMPDLKFNLASGAHPKIVFEGAISMPSFKVEVGVRAERGLFKALSATLPLANNSAGHAELELGRRFLDGALFTKPMSLIIKLYSNQYEGCLEFKTRPEVAPLTAFYTQERGVGMDQRQQFPLFALGELHLVNPNDYAMQVKVVGTVSALAGDKRLQPCIHRYKDTTTFDKLRCPAMISETITVQPHHIGGLGVFPALNLHPIELVSRGIRIDWSVTYSPDFDTLDQAEAPLAASIIP